MKNSVYIIHFFLILIFTSFIPLQGQGLNKIESYILSSGFFIKNFQLNYSPTVNDFDSYKLNLKEFQFEFSNVNYISLENNNIFESTIEFGGPKVSLNNLTLNANIYKSDWITSEKLERMYKRQSIPKLGILEIDQAISLYQTDHGNTPSSTNDLFVKNYLILDKEPFNNSLWRYSLDLPESIIASPTQNNPIPKTKSIEYDFKLKEFVTDPLIDSLESIQMLKWFYTFELNGVALNSTTSLDIKYNKSNSEFSLIMDQGSFKINNISFTGLPENKAKEKTVISLRELSIDCKNLILDGEYDSSMIFQKGEGQFRIEDFKVKIPAELGKEPEIEDFLSQIGVWNNSVSVRSVELRIKIINQFTGNIFLKVHTPFIKAVFNGNLSFRQLDIKKPKIKFHDAELTIHPIALGIKKWIRNWERTKKVSLKRKGPAVVIKLNGTLNSLDMQSLERITIF